MELLLSATTTIKKQRLEIANGWNEVNAIMWKYENVKNFVLR